MDEDDEIMQLVDALDQTHRDSVDAIDALRRVFVRMHLKVRTWQPRPCPPDWDPWKVV